MNKVIFYILPFLLLLVGCTKEETFPSEDDTVRPVVLSIVVPGGNSHTQTRTGVETGSTLENAIEYVYITITSSLKGDYDEVFKIRWTPSSLDKDTVAVVQCLVDASWIMDSGNLDATVYANYDTPPVDITSEMDFWEYDTELNKYFQKKFFMSGKAPITTDGSSFKGEINLNRQIAKIRVKVQRAIDCVPLDLEIKKAGIKVKIKRAAKKAHPLISQSNNQTYIDYDERTGDKLRSGQDAVVDSCYVNENIEGLFDGFEKTTLHITIPTKDPTTGNEEELTGVFEIKDENNNNDILRNHIYTIDIKVRSQSSPLFITSFVQPWMIVPDNIGPLEPVN